MRRSILTTLKILVTLTGLALVLIRIPLQDITAALKDVDGWWLAITIGLVTSSVGIRAYRWSTLLKGLNAKTNYGQLVELYMVGNFFNAFLPSGFGGDAVRVVEATRELPANIAAGTVIVDRLTGLLALFSLALVTLPFRPSSFSNRLTLIVMALSLIGIVGGMILLEGRFLRLLGGRLPSALSPEGEGPVARLLEAVQGCRRRAIAGALLISFFFNLMLVSWWYSAGRALELEVPISYYILVVPILSVALLVPSISGLGVRESIAPLLFSGAGLTDSQAVALSLLVFVAARAVSLLGAPVYIARSLRKDPQSSETS
jgi:uncharacterized membrane protein YbhN (UPF0104 family)